MKSIECLVSLECWCLFVFMEVCGSAEKMDLSLYEMIHQSCLDRTGYRPLDGNAFLRVIEVSELSQMKLPCNFCGENNEDMPWIWRWRQRAVNSTEEEVELDLGPVLETNRVFMYPNHTLIIQNVTVNDTGLYYCRSLVEEETRQFQFSVDVVQTDVPVVEERDTPWVDFQYKYVIQANEQIKTISSANVVHVLEKVSLRVESEWDPWLPCDGCTGERRRYAKCRIRPALTSDSEAHINVKHLDDLQSVLFRSFRISCHSVFLAQELPSLHEVVSRVPNYMKTQVCYDSCLREGRKEHEPRYYLDLKLQVDSSMAFVCPDSSLKSEVVWRKNGVRIKPVKAIKKKKPKKTLFKNPFQKPKPEFDKVFVDRFNVLQLWSISEAESAVYACYVGKDLVKIFNITVVTAEDAQRQRYYHYWLMSVYTSLTSSIIVLLGIGWATWRRHEFPTLEDIQASQNKLAFQDELYAIQKVPNAIPDDHHLPEENQIGYTPEMARYSDQRQQASRHKSVISAGERRSVQRRRQDVHDDYHPSEKKPLIS